MMRNWYAVYTKAQKEIRVAGLLTKKGIENYCPLVNVVNAKAADRKSSFEPLFNSFVFVYVTEQELALVKTVQDVINVIYWRSKPAVINDAEIAAIRNLTANYANIRLEKAMVKADAVVQKIEEPVIAYNENSVSVKYKAVKISLPSLGYTLIAERPAKKEKVVYEEAGIFGSFPKRINALFFN